MGAYHGITIQKQVGTRLPHMKRSCNGPAGRRGTIDRLKNYYGIAIRSNDGDLQGMKKPAHATMFHVSSCARNSLHDHSD